MIKIQLSLTQEQYDNVSLLAELRDRSRSWIVRDLIDRYEVELVRAIRKLKREAGK